MISVQDLVSSLSEPSDLNPIEALEDFIKDGGDVNQADSKGDTLLGTAVFEGHKEFVDRLIEAGADVDKARTSDGATPMHIAAVVGNIGAIQALADANANANIAQRDGRTPLDLLEPSQANIEVIAAIIRAGGDQGLAAYRTDKAPEKPETALGNLVGRLMHPQKLSQEEMANLRAFIADDNGQHLDTPASEIGANPLQAAAHGGHAEAIEALIKGGASVNGSVFSAQHDVTGAQAPAYIAARRGHAGAFEALAKAGADIHAHVIVDGAVKSPFSKLQEKISAAQGEMKQVQADEPDNKSKIMLAFCHAANLGSIQAKSALGKSTKSFLGATTYEIKFDEKDAATSSPLSSEQIIEVVRGLATVDRGGSTASKMIGALAQASVSRGAINTTQGLESIRAALTEGKSPEFAAKSESCKIIDGCIKELEERNKVASSGVATSGAGEVSKKPAIAAFTAPSHSKMSAILPPSPPRTEDPRAPSTASSTWVARVSAARGASQDGGHGI